jgi:uncharacterized protein YlxW (UPF0749 family)
MDYSTLNDDELQGRPDDILALQEIIRRLNDQNQRLNAQIQRLNAQVEELRFVRQQFVLFIAERISIMYTKESCSRSALKLLS